MDGFIKNIEDVFTQNKVQLYFFLGIGIAFSLLVLWMFLFRQDIPEKLMQMTLAVWGMLWAGIAKGVSKIETLLNKDINGDGVIGENTNSSTNSTNSISSLMNSIKSINQNNNSAENTLVESTPVVNVEAPVVELVAPSTQNITNNSTILTGVDAANI